jgi:hypothetical protein
MPTPSFLNQHYENNCPGDELPGIFDPAAIPDTPGAKAIIQIIDANAAWLQAEPRTTLSIILKLFPGELRRMSDASEVIEWLGGYLWDSGYTPRWTTPNNPTWHWREGTSQFDRGNVPASLICALSRTAGGRRKVQGK